MKAPVLRILKIHEGEGQKVLQLAVIGALLQAGVAIGMSAADSLFLTRLGAEKLPIIYFIMPLFMTVVVPVYSYLVERHGVDRMMDTTLFALASGGGLLFCSLTLFGLGGQGNPGTWVYYGIEVYASLWQIIVFTILWTFIEEYFDILSAKRLFPVLCGGTALGAMLGGGLVTALATSIGVAALFLVWSGLALAAYPVTVQLRRTAYKLEETETDEPPSLSEQLQNITATVRSSPYVLYLNLAVFLLMFLTTICEYQFYGVFEKQGDEQELAVFFGRLVIAVNVFNLVMSFFLFNRLVSAIGVRNTALIQPLAYLGIFGYFVLDLHLTAAIIGFFVCNGIQDVVEDNNWNFLLNPVSPQVNKSIRAFAEGVVDPLGSSLAGLFLILFAPKANGAQLLGIAFSPLQISCIAVGGSVAYLVIVLLLRHHYLGSMVQNLRREWLDFSRSETDVLRGLAPQEQQALMRRAAQKDVDIAEAAMRILWLNDRAAAVRALLAMLTRLSEAEQGRFCPLLGTMLESHDDDTIRQVIDWLERERVKPGPSLIEELGRHSLVPAKEWAHWLESPTTQKRAAIMATLGHSWDPESGLQAIEGIVQLLRGNDEERLMGIRALGGLQQERYAHYLVPYLYKPAAAVQKETLFAVNRLVNHESGRLLPHLLRAVAQGEGENRIVAMEALAKIGDSDCIPALLAEAGSFVPCERRKAEQLILTIGLRSIPATISVLRNPSYPYEARSIAARAIAKLAFPQLRAFIPEIIGQEIDRAYQYLCYHHVLAQATQASPGLQVLSRFYTGVQLIILEFVLQILALGGRLPDYEMISSSLRSQNPKVRANAIEALEQACNRAIFLRLLPLVDSRPLEDIIRFYQRHEADAELTPATIIAKASHSHVPLERSAAAQAMWDLAFPEVLNTLRQQLHDTSSSLFRDTVMSLLIRAGNGMRSNPIEMIALLSRTAFFTSFSVLDLVTLAAGIREVSFAAQQPVYRQGEAAYALYVIKAGNVILNGHDRVLARGAGDTFGEETVYGTDTYREDAISRSASVYVVERDYLMQCVRTHPRMALGLIEKHVVPR
jgi:Cyclic nucleotide-binding domain